MATTPNPFERGLIIRLEGATATEEAMRGRAVVKIEGSPYDVTPYLQAYEALGANITSFSKNPYNTHALLNLQKLSHQLHPSLKRMSTASPGVRQFLHPMVQGLASYMKNAQSLVKMRLKTSHHLARSPKILIPISLSIAAGGTTASIQVRNPYLGATDGATGPYQYPWTITAFRTSNGESGALLPIRITQFLIGGHDFVAASLAGLTYAGGGAPATQGWPAGAFAETARKIWMSTVQPWNVVAMHGSGTGFGSIMTETGLLQIGVFNGGGGTYVDTYSVYANATLCGNPFTIAKWTQVDAFRKAFAPLHLQAPLAMKLAGDAMSHVGSAMDRDDPNYDAGPYGFADRISRDMREIEGFLDNPPEGVAMGDVLGAPEDFGRTLSPETGARFADF